jgi:hypothetical protein
LAGCWSSEDGPLSSLLSSAGLDIACLGTRIKLQRRKQRERGGQMFHDGAIGKRWLVQTAHAQTRFVVTRPAFAVSPLPPRVLCQIAHHKPLQARQSAWQRRWSWLIMLTTGQVAGHVCLPRATMSALPLTADVETTVWDGRLPNIMRESPFTEPLAQ